LIPNFSSPAGLSASDYTGSGRRLEISDGTGQKGDLHGSITQK
jgi:hypothetical protein